jgi:hypothetical protein
MTTLTTVQNQIDGAIVPNNKGGITAVVLASVLRNMVSLFSNYAPLLTPSFTGPVNVDGAPIASAAFLATSGVLQPSNNLSELVSAPLARSHLGLSAVASSGAYADLIGTPTATLAGNADVTITSPANGDTIIYNAATSKFVNSHRNPIATQTANYVLALTDDFTTIICNSASALTCTVPPNSSVAFRVGDEISLIQGGAGSLSVVAGAGVTINSPAGLVFNSKNLQAILTKTATDTWNLTYLGLPAANPLPVYNAGSVSGTIVLDYRNGDVQVISLTGNTTYSISNWPATGLAKLTLIAQNTGAYTLTHPTSKWGNSAAAPTLTSGAGKEDWYMQATFDGGATLRGNVINQNYG